MVINSSVVGERRDQYTGTWFCCINCQGGETQLLVRSPHLNELLAWFKSSVCS